MELSGTKIIHAERSAVWEALNNPTVLKEAVPGCSEMNGSAEEGFDAVVTQKVGPVKATFKGNVTLSNIVPEQSYTISGKGSGGVAGFASGGADVVLTDHAEGTELSYTVNAKVGGKLAQLGSRLINGFAAKMADQFFVRFKDAVESDGAEGGEATADQGEAPAPKPGFLKRVLG